MIGDAMIGDTYQALRSLLQHVQRPDRRTAAGRRAPIAAAAAIAAVMTLGHPSAPAIAQTCGEPYSIKAGETLADIAARTYGDPSRWTVIFYANQERLGSNASLLVPGLEIRLPCIGGRAARPAANPAETTAAPRQQQSQNGIVVSSMVRRIEFLTADDYAPFTGRGLEGGGMMTEVVNAAMGVVKEEARGRLDFGISWVNDWSAHLDPLLTTRAFDVGYPWIKPNCGEAAALDDDAKFRCNRFFFSDPMYEFMLQLFVRADSRIDSLADEAIKGTTLCRPAGYSMDSMNANGRNWLSEDKITLLRPATVDECFRLLGEGTIDGVVINEFVGLSSVNSQGLKEIVRAVNEPLELSTLHAIVTKTHPQARTILYYINEGIKRVRESGDYDQIVERHLLRFWNAQSSAPDPGLATAPAATTPAPSPAAPATTGGTRGGAADSSVAKNATR